MDEARANTAAGGGTSRFIAGDALRAWPAIGVVSYHILAASVGHAEVGITKEDFEAAIGWAATPVRRADFLVYVFFALSGYLLGLPFARAAMTGRRFPRVGKYFRNRVLRIVPAFWFFLTVTWLIHGRGVSSWGEVAASYAFGQIYDLSTINLTMPQNWTLDNEAVFYLVLPLMGLAAVSGLRALRPAWRLAGGLAALAVVAVVSLQIRATHLTFLELSSPPAIFWTFTPGLALAFLEPVLRPRLEGSRHGPLLAAAMFALFAVGASIYFFSSAAFTVRNVAAAFGCFGYIGGPLVLQWSTGRCWKAFDNRPMNWIGARSYSFYLGHVIVVYLIGRRFIDMFDEALPGFLAALVPVMAISLLVAWAGFRWIEEPSMRRRLPWRRSTGPAAAGPGPAPSVARVPAG